MENLTKLIRKARGKTSRHCDGTGGWMTKRVALISTTLFDSLHALHITSHPSPTCQL
jgi:hypothetical protein